ncbi:MAG: hypothetical protein JNK14_10805 [Chitinophagaceae bacterium]|nr:hypothetical protein [Chitinophagaceae bacterium]
MKSILRTVACLCVITSLATGAVYAQLFNDPKFQLGASIGTFVYQGDLTPSAMGSYRTLKPSVNLFASKLISSTFSWRVNLAFGGLKGNDAKYSNPEYRQQRNFNFTSRVLEVSGMAEWSILGRNYISRGFAPYLFAGIGYNFINVKRDYSHLNAEYFGTESELITGLTTDAQRSLPRGLLVLPVGAGSRYYLSDRVGISAETSYRIMSNDYLDGFSQAANPNKGDHYYSHMIGVVYRLGKKNTLGCPVVRY